MNEITPLKRMGTSEDIALAAEFFCSPSSCFINGQTLFIDGGLSIMGQEQIIRNYLNI